MGSRKGGHGAACTATQACAAIAAEGAGFNGQQTNLSLRSELNAHTGYFEYPWTAPDPEPIIGRRLHHGG